MKLISHYIEQQKKRYPEITNWKNHIISDRLSYSYRDTVYDRGTYPSDLHCHDYYEFIIFARETYINRNTETSFLSLQVNFICL